MPRQRARTLTAAASTPAQAADAPPAGLDDAALVAAARADPPAFAFLYERYAARIHRYCYLKLGSREAAEDATSQVFLKALDSLDGYRGGYFAGWLFRIAQHTVTDLHRARRATLPVAAAEQLRDPNPMPDQHVIQQAEFDALRAALERLSPDQRAVLELQLADLSTEEIAGALGRSANAVRILRFRAFQRLRTLLGTRDMASRTGAEPC